MGSSHCHKILVSGAAGFIGSHLCERLIDDGHQVVGIDSFSSSYDSRIKRDNLEAVLNKSGMTLVEESLNEIDLDPLLADVHSVFHFAAQAGVRESWRDRFDEYVDSNIRATQKLCEAARGKALRSFVFASSSSVYGETAELPIKESHPARPLSPYGVTKLAAESLCLLYKKNFNLPVVCLRFFTVYGPRQRPDMAFHKFIKSALDGAPVEVFGNGTQTRDFTYVSDVVEASVRAMDYRGKEAVFNIGAGRRVTVNHALDVLGGLVPQRLDVVFRNRREGEVTHTFADIGLASREIGFSPTLGLEEGMSREVEWLKTIGSKLGSS